MEPLNSNSNTKKTALAIAAAGTLQQHNTSALSTAVVILQHMRLLGRQARLHAEMMI